MVKLAVALSAIILAGSAIAHQGHNVKQEALERRAFLDSKPRTIRDCAAKLKARGHTDRAIVRRAAIANKLRDERGLNKRDLTSVLDTSHHSNLIGITPNTPETVLFSDNSSCVLQPDVTEGPYYVAGELIRKDIREHEEGVDNYVYIQVVDVATCDPIENIYVDVWHANSTGVYSGIVANGNGNSDDAANINTTVFRGLQPTDSDGVAEFVTIVPGHYTGRTNHIHIFIHSPSDTMVYPNGTLGTDELLAVHVGQLFFDQSLLEEVEATYPYYTNTQNLTTNAEDYILAEEAATEDPMVEYVLLGSDIRDGILSWATVAINTTDSITVNDAAYIDSDGGHSTGYEFNPGKA